MRQNKGISFYSTTVFTPPRWLRLLFFWRYSHVTEHTLYIQLNVNFFSNQSEYQKSLLLFCCPSFFINMVQIVCSYLTKRRPVNQSSKHCQFCFWRLAWDKQHIKSLKWFFFEILHFSCFTVFILFYVFGEAIKSPPKMLTSINWFQCPEKTRITSRSIWQ